MREGTNMCECSIACVSYFNPRPIIRLCVCLQLRLTYKFVCEANCGLRLRVCVCECERERREEIQGFKIQA